MNMEQLDALAIEVVDELYGESVIRMSNDKAKEFARLLLQKVAEKSEPVGVVEEEMDYSPFTGNSIPTGRLLCDFGNFKFSKDKPPVTSGTPLFLHPSPQSLQQYGEKVREAAAAVVSNMQGWKQYSSSVPYVQQSNAEESIRSMPLPE